MQAASINLGALAMIKPRSTAFFYLALSVLLQSAAYGIGKQAAISIESYSLIAVLSNPFYLAGLVCLGLHAVVWQLVLRILPLSQAYFFMSIVFVNILFISRIFFNEVISIMNILGAVVIMMGVAILTREIKAETSA